MSNIVEQINDSIKAIVAAQLGVDYSELAYIYDLNKNTSNGTNKKYGVKPSAVSPSISITRHYTAEQEFSVILTHTYTERDGDSLTRANVFLGFSHIDNILKELINKKAGLPAIVLNIPSFEIAEVEIDLEEKIITQTATFSVMYRQALN